MRTPEDYKNPDNFKTNWPNETHLQKQKYDEGLALSREAYAHGGAVHIAESGVWSARWPNTTIQSYEKIGYHAGTCYFLRGLLDGPAPVWVFPAQGPSVKIKEEGVVDEHVCADARRQLQYSKVRQSLQDAGFTLAQGSKFVFVSPVTLPNGKRIEIVYEQDEFVVRDVGKPLNRDFRSDYGVKRRYVGEQHDAYTHDITPEGAWKLVSYAATNSNE